MSAAKHDRLRFLLAQLDERRTVNGTLSTQAVVAAAALAGVSERTMWRWVAEGAPPAPNAKEACRLNVDDDLLDVYYEAKGNVSAVHRLLVQRLGEGAPSRRTLARACDRIPLMQKEAARHGHAGRRQHVATFTITTAHRNAVWQTDHKQVPVEVIPPVGKKVVRPWLTTFIDDYTRAIMGYVVSIKPTSAEVVAALKHAMVIDDDWGPFGGVPDTIVCDRGLDFLSDAVAEVAVTIGTVLHPLPAYSPHLKGKVERWHRTIDDMFASGLPGFTDGPRRADNQLYGSTRRLVFSDFVAELDAFIRSYNCERAHGGMDGETPLERWSGDSFPLRTLSDDDLKWMALPSHKAMVTKGAIRFKKTRYMHSALANLSGQEVEIRYMPHDNRGIDVYIDGVFLCRAEPEPLLSADAQKAIIDERSRANSEERKRRKREAQRVAVRLNPTNGDGATEIARNITERQARSEGLQRKRRAATSTSALEAALGMDGLNEPIDLDDESNDNPEEKQDA
jgi:putative transposase